MSTQAWARLAAYAPAAAKPFKLLSTALIPMVMLAACRDAPAPPLAGPHPADPAAPTAGVRYRSTTGGYTSQRPVEPAPWGEQNQRVAPQPKSDR